MIPLYSPIVEKIEIVKKTKTRRAKLYYVRDKSDRALRKKLRATTLSEVITTGTDEEVTDEIAETAPSTEEQASTEPQAETDSETKKEASAPSTESPKEKEKTPKK